MEAIKADTDYFINQLQHLLEIDEDEPDKILHSEDGASSKWRTGWFTVVAGNLKNLVYFGLVDDPSIIEIINKAGEAWINPAFTTKPLTTRKDIDQGKRVLEIVLDHLKSKKSS